MTPTFSPNSNSVSLALKTIRSVINIIAVATIEENVSTKKRYGCLRENIKRYLSFKLFDTKRRFLEPYR
jgi:hypothetical protein